MTATSSNTQLCDWLIISLSQKASVILILISAYRHDITASTEVQAETTPPRVSVKITCDHAH